MSRRNKIEAKRARRACAPVPTSGVTPVSHIPLAVSERILSNPKQMKLSGKSRRRLLRSRGLVVEDNKVLSGGTGIHSEVKAALKLEKLSLAKLIRRLKQAARRASNCKHLIAALHVGSKFGPSLAAEQTHQLCLAKQIQAEIKSRNHTK